MNWTESDDQYLRDHYPNTATAQVAAKLGRTVKSIYMRAKVLNVPKDAAFVAETGRKSGSTEAARAHQFRKGHTPWNAGTKGVMKAQATSFKPGNLPSNTKYDGALSIRVDSHNKSYLYRRVSLGRWVLEHRRLWKEAHGKIGRGNVIVFKDGNPMNCTLENLECITRAENMNRNTIHNYPDDLKEIIRTITKLNKQINRVKK